MLECKGKAERGAWRRGKGDGRFLMLDKEVGKWATLGQQALIPGSELAVTWAASCSCAALPGEEHFHTGKRDKPSLPPNWKKSTVKHNI